MATSKGANSNSDTSSARHRRNKTTRVRRDEMLVPFDWQAQLPAQATSRSSRSNARVALIRDAAESDKGASYVGRAT